MKVGAGHETSHSYTQGPDAVGQNVGTIDFVARIGNSSCAPIAIVDFAMAHPLHICDLITFC